eukprot:2243294-Alexandrium_andersonii.AAC.1
MARSPAVARQWRRARAGLCGSLLPRPCSCAGGSVTSSPAKEHLGAGRPQAAWPCSPRNGDVAMPGLRRGHRVAGSPQGDREAGADAPFHPAAAAPAKAAQRNGRQPHRLRQRAQPL